MLLSEWFWQALPFYKLCDMCEVQPQHLSVQQLRSPYCETTPVKKCVLSVLSPVPSTNHGFDPTGNDLPADDDLTVLPHSVLAGLLCTGL